MTMSSPTGGATGPGQPLRAAVYNRFWHSMGGGERHAGMIAQLLAAGGVQTDLLGHSAEVDRDELAERLGLDLSGCTMRVIPDRGDADLAAHSAQYDLFVNATYMSRLGAQALRSAFLCFFPTPFDHDLTRWHRAAASFLGPPLRKLVGDVAIHYGTGWFPPEGGRRRRWTWSNGTGILALAPGPTRTIQADFARVGSSGPCTVTIADETGALIDSFVATREFRRRRITLPASETGTEIHVTSPTFVPGGADLRTLGVGMSRLRVVGSASLAARAAGRFPWLVRGAHDLDFVQTYDVVLANSAFTQMWLQRLWATPAEILYPPIDVDGIAPAAERSRTVLSVGRFFRPGLGHAKRQLEMVEAFGAIVRAGGLDGWQLVVVGGCEKSQIPYLAKVQRAAEGLPVTIYANAPRDLVQRLLATSAIFWSATGLGEDEQRAPWTQEHFGMTTVEAMAGGCVPVVIDRAGQREIVRDGVDGFRWSTIDELTTQTLLVADDVALRARLSAAAIERAKDFSDTAFAARWHELAETYRLLG